MEEGKKKNGPLEGKKEIKLVRTERATAWKVKISLDTKFKTIRYTNIVYRVRLFSAQNAPVFVLRVL